MGYDIYVGAAFPGAAHAMTIEERLFDKFVASHAAAVPPFKLISRMRDAYGDASFLASEISRVVVELAELEQACTDPDVRKLCRSLCALAAAAHEQGASIFCCGD